MSLQILVTGGLGYIGSHTVVALVEAGFEPIIVDNLSNTSIAVLDSLEKICERKLTFYELDICETAQLEGVFKNHPIKSIIHFAAFKAVGESVTAPLKYYKNNIGGLLSLLSVMESNKIKNIVFSSSCTVYGDPDLLPVNEECAIKPATSPYGATKQMGEQILKDGQLNVIALRYFNPIGAHERATIGEMPLGVPNNLIPYVTQTAIGKRVSLTVNGGDYPTADGTNIRDYIDVQDLAEAHVAAINRQLSTPVSFEAINIGTGIGASVLEVIKTFEKVNKIKLNYTIGPRRAGDVVQIYGAVDKAKRLLNWSSKRSLADSLKSAWEWEKHAATRGF